MKLKIVPIKKKFGKETKVFRDAKRHGWTIYKPGVPYVMATLGYRYFADDVEIDLSGRPLVQSPNP